MYNFFVSSNQIREGKIQITGEDYNHIKNVLRMSIGDRIFVVEPEEQKRFEAEVEGFDTEGKFVNCKIIDELPSTEPKINLTIFQGIPKSDKMELIIQKCTELGMSNLYPVEMKYCIGKIKNENKISRWNTIAEAAAKQSKRTIIPKIENSIGFEKMLEMLNNYDLVVTAYEKEAQSKRLKETLKTNPDAKNIAIIIGPEGGISESEVEKLEANGVKMVSLGKRILRTETATIATTAMIMYELD